MFSVYPALSRALKVPTLVPVPGEPLVWCCGSFHPGSSVVQCFEETHGGEGGGQRGHSGADLNMQGVREQEDSAEGWALVRGPSG